MASKIRIWPSTALGLWGLGLIFAFGALFLLKTTVGLPLLTFAIFGIGIVGVTLGIIAVARRDRSWVLFIVGGAAALFIVFWVGGEFLYPH